MKESSRGTYNISPYMIANSIVFLPFLFIVVILFVIPVYWIVGLNPSIAAFVFFAFVVWLIVLMASSLLFSQVQSLLTLLQEIHSSTQFLEHSFSSLDTSFQILVVHVYYVKISLNLKATAASQLNLPVRGNKDSW